MAKLIILEGIERCGKTTLIEILHRDNIGTFVKPGKKQPDDIPFEHLGIFYEGIHNFTQKFLKIIPNDTYIFDRFFLSEFVYSEQFKRKTYMDIDYVKELSKDNEITMFYLKNTHKDYLNRGPKNKVKLTSTEYTDMQYLFASHIFEIQHQVPKINIEVIDTSVNDLKTVYNIIKDKI